MDNDDDKEKGDAFQLKEEKAEVEKEDEAKKTGRSEDRQEAEQRDSKVQRIDKIAGSCEIPTETFEQGKKEKVERVQEHHAKMTHAWRAYRLWAKRQTLQQEEQRGEVPHHGGLREDLSSRKAEPSSTGLTSGDGAGLSTRPRGIRGEAADNVPTKKARTEPAAEHELERSTETRNLLAVPGLALRPEQKCTVQDSQLKQEGKAQSEKEELSKMLEEAISQAEDVGAEDAEDMAEILEKTWPAQHMDPYTHKEA